MMHPIIYLIHSALGVYSFVLFIYIILQVLIQFEVINRNQQLVAIVYNALYRFYEPVLRAVRKYMPQAGGLDFSPIVVFIGIGFIRYSLVYYF